MPPPPSPIPYFAHPDTALRLRFWFGRKLRDEVWMDASDPESDHLAESVASYHMRLSDLADAVGVPWMVEAYDPAAPEGHGFMRFGTDAEWIAGPQEEIAAPPPVPGQRDRNPVSGPLPRYDEPTQP